MISRIFAKLQWWIRVFLTKTGNKRTYKIGSVHVKLDYTHRLPDYQSSHPLYDRFLPHIVRYLPAGSIVVDVGANVGDTLAGMVAVNPELVFVCIEADFGFYEDLIENVKIIQSELPESQIFTDNVFVGQNISNVSLDGSGGTRHAVISGGSIQSQPLIKILENSGVNGQISLIKTDVDGFDYDVLRSAYDTLADSPYLYFECQCENDLQLSGYIELFAELSEKGYEYFAIFDNFGQFILVTDDSAQLEDLLNYAYRQHTAKSTRTLYYYDILSFKRRELEAVRTIVSEYVLA